MRRGNEFTCAVLAALALAMLSTARAEAPPPEAQETELQSVYGKDLPSRRGLVAEPAPPPPAPPPAAPPRNEQSPPASEPAAQAATEHKSELAEQHTAELLGSSNDSVARIGSGFLVHDDNYFAMGAGGENLGKVKFQVSVRYELFTLGITRGYSLSFAYTQKSFWDVFNGKDSAPFLENNYRPEGFFSFRPRRDKYANEFSTGVRHESNGLGLIEGKQEVDQSLASKSWNQVYLSARHNLSPQIAAGKFRIRVAGMLRLWVPFGVSAGELPRGEISDEQSRAKQRADDELQRVLGYGSATLDVSVNSSWLYKRANLDNESKGLLRITAKQRSAEISLYVPLWSRGLFKAAFYFQVFTGKAERLMTYDHRTNCFYAGIGLL